jgi:hypothetical protein
LGPVDRVDLRVNIENRLGVSKEVSNFSRVDRVKSVVVEIVGAV